MVGFTDSLRCELIHDKSKVRVTVVHMPGLNTPQFNWCLSHMPRKAQPVPPIYQPEAGAEAVYWAAHHHRRELFVGWPTVQAIWGQRLLPRFLDHYLAKRAWDGQMYDSGRDQGVIDLYEPVHGHQGAHGAFDERARMHGGEVWLTTRVPWAAAATTAALAATTVMLARAAQH